MRLRDRLHRLETQTASKHEPLTERDRQMLERWPEIMLERYCEGRLDALAARPDMPGHWPDAARPGGRRLRG